LKSLRLKILALVFWWFIVINVQNEFTLHLWAQPVSTQQDAVHPSEQRQQTVSEANMDGGIFDDIVDALTPGIFRDVRKLRNYIRSGEYAGKIAVHGDLYAMDDIYQKALDIEEGCIQDALFVSALAVVDHKKLELHFPLNITIPVPLTLESDTLFNARLRNLPAHIYPDSPRDWFGDKDKPQHFFGSAYLTYLLRSREIADFIGKAIEQGESIGGLEGAGDPRDVRSNRHGQDFGMALLRNPTMKPSDIIRFEIAHELIQQLEIFFLTIEK